MLPELDPHLDKIMLRFREAELRVAQVSNAAALRGAVAFKQRTLQEVSHMLAELYEDTKGPVAALIRLHYVRSSRAVNPEFKLGHTEEQKVNTLAHQAHRGLALAINGIYQELQVSFKRMTVASVSSQMTATAASAPLEQSLNLTQRRRRAGLEQCARTLLTNVGGQAEHYGRVAAQAHESYGMQHA